MEGNRPDPVIVQMMLNCPGAFDCIAKHYKIPIIILGEILLYIFKEEFQSVPFSLLDKKMLQISQIGVVFPRLDFGYFMGKNRIEEKLEFLSESCCHE